MKTEWNALALHQAAGTATGVRAVLWGTGYGYAPSLLEVSLLETGHCTAALA